jgi:hypothetical protein
MKAGTFLVSLLPLATLGWRAWHEDLGANPIEFITHATGDWALRFLLITLAITPLRTVLSMPRITQFRRMLGLFAFLYGCLHFLTYLWSEAPALRAASDAPGTGDSLSREFPSRALPLPPRWTAAQYHVEPRFVCYFRKSPLICLKNFADQSLGVAIASL